MIDATVAEYNTASIDIHAREWPEYSANAITAASDLIESGHLYGYRPDGVVSQLENTVREFHDGVEFVLSHSSGTSALLAAYVGLNIGLGDEVIVPVITYVATVTPLFLLGAVPIMCDSDPDTGNINVSLVEPLISKNTRAIVVTHLWGHPVEIDELVVLANRYNIPIIEDCSHAHGALYKGRKVGTFGAVGIFSMGAAKMVTGGMGGMLMTRDAQVYNRALILGHCRGRGGETLSGDEYKWLSDVGYGANHRITLVSALLCLDHFKSLSARIEEKHNVLNSLSGELANICGILPPTTRPYVDRGAWYGYNAEFVVQETKWPCIEDFFAACRKIGLRLRRPRSGPLNLMRAFQSRKIGFRVSDSIDRPLYSPGDFPVAEKFYATRISFPVEFMHFQCPELIKFYTDGLKYLLGTRST